MTPANLETYVRQRYNAVGDSFFPQTEIFNHFYAAQTELAMETFCVRNVYTTTSVDGQRVYDFPSKTISIMRVEYDGERIFPNDFVDDDGLTGNSPDETIEGRSQNYQVWGNQLYLRPTPDTSGLTIKIYSYDLPDQPSTTAAFDVPERYHMMLADYALFCMFAKDKNYQMADYHKKIWNTSKETVVKVERQRAAGDSFRVIKDIEDLWDESRFI